MKKNWFYKKISELSAYDGYIKPDIHKYTLKLNSNENFVIDKQFQIDIMKKIINNSDIREYPNNKIVQLLSSISKYVNLSISEIAIGNGSDQIIDLLLSHLVSKNTKILTSDPTFNFFDERCKLYSIKTVKIPFSSTMQLDYNDFVTKSKKADMIYLDSPNNPTGFQFTKNNMIKIINEFNGPIIIDEAYGEFSDYSLSRLIKNHDNLIIIKTFSKAFGLAGLRLGYFLAHEKIIDIFKRKIQYPYPINSIAIDMGILLLKKYKIILKSIDIIKTEREKMITLLRKFNTFDVFDSKANFILFDAKEEYNQIYTALSEQGVLIRKLGKIGRHKGCLRVTLGTKEMNSKFILAIRDLLR